MLGVWSEWRVNGDRVEVGLSQLEAWAQSVRHGRALAGGPVPVVFFHDWGFDGFPWMRVPAADRELWMRVRGAEIYAAGGCFAFPVTGPSGCDALKDGTLGATYSWGNKANLRGWHKNAAEDIAAAKVALAGKAALNPAGDANLSPWLEEAYRQRSSPEFEHANKWVDANCKTEADGLLKLAQELKENKGK